MNRIPLTLRALVLVPLLAVLVDQTRASLMCGARAESCLEAAGQGWLGPAGGVLLVAYALLGALFVGRVARHANAQQLPFLQLWAVGAVGVGAVCGGQALLAGALGTGALLGGGWAGLIVLCVVAGGLIALALRVAPAAATLLRSLRPRAPRPRLPTIVAHLAPALPARRPTAFLSLAAAGRAPPLHLG